MNEFLKNKVMPSMLATVMAFVALHLAGCDAETSTSIPSGPKDTDEQPGEMPSQNLPEADAANLEATPDEYFEIEERDGKRVITEINFPPEGIKTIVIPKDIDEVDINHSVESNPFYGTEEYRDITYNTKEILFEDGSNPESVVIVGLPIRLDKIVYPDSCVAVTLKGISSVDKVVFGSGLEGSRLHGFEVCVSNGRLLDVSKVNFRWEYDGEDIDPFPKITSVLRDSWAQNSLVAPEPVTVMVKDKQDAVNFAKWWPEFMRSWPGERDGAEMPPGYIEIKGGETKPWAEWLPDGNDNNEEITPLDHESIPNEAGETLDDVVGQYRVGDDMRYITGDGKHWDNTADGWRETS